MELGLEAHTRASASQRSPDRRTRGNGYWERAWETAWTSRSKHGRALGGAGRDHEASEAEPFWRAFLCSLADRGLRSVKLVIADDHKGLHNARGYNQTGGAFAF